jgi:acyl-CoA thioesterase-1
MESSPLTAFGLDKAGDRRQSAPPVLVLATLAVTALLEGCGPMERGPLVAFLGDSLTSGWRLPPTQAYPARVGEALRARGRPIRVLNAGVSGDTVARGLRRLEPVLAREPAVLVVALGINDGLRGLSLEAMEGDLAAIVDRGQAARARVVLVGMRIPDRAHGLEYAERFAALYPRLAASRRTHFVPFLLEGVAGFRDLNFPDGLHPNGAGHARLARNVVREIELALAEVQP